MRTKSTDPRILAIRKHPQVGEGTCASVDECYSDADLSAILDQEGISTPEAAVALAMQMEEVWLEQGLNQRYGDDDDPQLKQWKDWMQEKDARSDPDPEQ